MRRFRLISLVVAMLIASVLMGLNLRGTWRRDVGPDTRNYQGFYEYGFPCSAVVYPAWLHLPSSRYLESFHRGMSREEQDALMLRVEGAVLSVEPTATVRSGSLSLNALTLVMAAGVALFGCEVWVRRRELRVHAA